MKQNVKKVHTRLVKLCCCQDWQLMSRFLALLLFCDLHWQCVVKVGLLLGIQSKRTSHQNVHPMGSQNVLVSLYEQFADVIRIAFKIMWLSWGLVLFNYLSFNQITSYSLSVSNKLNVNKDFICITCNYKNELLKFLWIQVRWRLRGV